MNNSGAFRSKRVYFSQVSNEALRDPDLSLKAKGLFALIQSYITIENFTLYKGTLKKSCQEGRNSFDAAWKELKDKGYLVQYKLKNEKGGFYYEYELLDKSHIPKTCSVGFVGMENLYDGKQVQYNNTDTSNTDSNNTYSISSSEEAEVLEAYKNSKGKIVSPAEKKKLKVFIQTYTAALVLKAIEETVMRADKFNLAYVESCLKDWVDLEGYEKSKASKNTLKPKNKGVQKGESTFNNFKQRDYDFNELKDKLITHDEEVLKEADCSKCNLFRKNRCIMAKKLDANNMCSSYVEIKED